MHLLETNTFNVFFCSGYLVGNSFTRKSTYALILLPYEDLMGTGMNDITVSAIGAVSVTFEFFLFAIHLPNTFDWRYMKIIRIHLGQPQPFNY